MISGPLPHKRRQIRAELKRLIESEYPNWKKRKYLSTKWIMAGLNENPEKYPILSKIHQRTVKRWLIWYLKDHGRVPSNEKAAQPTTFVLATMKGREA